MRALINGGLRHSLAKLKSSITNVRPALHVEHVTGDRNIRSRTSRPVELPVDAPRTLALRPLVKAVNAERQQLIDRLRPASRAGTANFSQRVAQQAFSFHRRLIFLAQIWQVLCCR